MMDKKLRDNKGRFLKGTTITIKCKYCGETRQVYPSEIKKGRGKFCLREKKCQFKWMSENLSGANSSLFGRRGENHPNWKGEKVEIPCFWCGKKLKRKPSRIKKGGNNFCSGGKCFGKWYSKNLRGKKHHLWKEKIEVNCGWCNKTLKVYPYRIKASKEIFCVGSKCQYKWRSKNMAGENSPRWLGGISYDPYSLDWTETLRISIRERDKYICQICNKKQGDKAHCVHHINYDKKNCNPDNLITLCGGCNSTVNANRKHWTKYFQERLK